MKKKTAPLRYSVVKFTVIATLLGSVLLFLAPDTNADIAVDATASATPMHGVPIVTAPDKHAYSTWTGSGSVVNFGHSYHVDELGTECSECHHLERCDYCHGQQEQKQLVGQRRPATHTVCLRCHDQKLGEPSCQDCHKAKDSSALMPGQGVSASAMHLADKQKKLSTKAPEQMLAMAQRLEVVAPERGRIAPERISIFPSAHKGMQLASFPHQKHAARKGVQCALCHHLERCDRCHDSSEQMLTTPSLHDAIHTSCVQCHQRSKVTTSCEQCHLPSEP